MTEHFSVAVIGSGPGGYIAALKAAQMGGKTAVIEKHLLGGTCLNYGCIPSKALLASAELLHRIRHCETLGVQVNGSVGFDWSAIQKRKDKVLAKLRGGIKGLFAARQVRLYEGTAALDGPGKIRITDGRGQIQTITAERIILAVGSVPARISGWPTDPEKVCTSDEALHWKELPGRLLIVGGGVIGCEFACMMHEYGVEVTVVEMMEELLPEMEPELGRTLNRLFTQRGIRIFTGTKVESLTAGEKGVSAVLSNGQTVEADKVLIATGRRPNTPSLGLETVGLQTDRGFIRVNERMETSAKGIFCIGDANGLCLLAHAASAQGITAAENAVGRSAAYTLPVPYAVYTFPEIASVGLTSRQARRQNIPIRIGQFPIGYLGKAMAVGEESGFVRVISRRDDGALLGVHIVGHNATEIIESAVAMLGMKAKAKDLGEMIFAHPTLSEAVKEAAEDVYEQALHLPPRKVIQMAAETETVG
ncbi:MAG TPA: dihydrolipoyl dehydrogenase [Anaerohalosphaeraceae bacterium]|nr:dihydrolipoyl dehydrogenase [Anaerohalosphaeraceae bacterium]HOL88524.1 dihydrolipoyl dehydrogenase [Anaerohalosphaeraceae bacterium]HPP56422.1 dihydrolipoyl dehydrogenase [Anaerohalosphaeraceae bacterium]